MQLAVMSKRLATINRYVPIEISFNEMKIAEPDYDQLIELYTKLEFNSFLKKLSDKKTKTELTPQEVPDVKMHILRNETELEDWKLQEGCGMFLKVFSDFNHVQQPDITGIFLMGNCDAWYINCDEVPAAMAVSALNRQKLSLWGHDIKDDLYALTMFGFSQYEVVYDTAIAEYVLDVSRNSYDLKSLAFERLHVEVEDAEDYITGSGQLDMFTDKTEKYASYGAICGGVATQLRKLQEKELTEKGLERVFYEAELPLIEVLADMEAEGIRADKKFLDDFGTDIQEKIQVLERQIYEYAGTTFNINSPYQLGDVLFEMLGLPAGKKTKRGYSTSADILEKIRDKHPIVDAVLEYRNLTKLKSTYVEGMKPLIGGDGKIRAHFQQTVTTTGRISCTEPNLQNIPIRQELGRRLRKAFLASDEKHILIGADYSQIELRVLAHLSQDESLLEAFNHGEDIHKTTASRVLGIPMDKVTAADRSRAKAVNFGVIYGMSGFGLSENLHITRKDAEAYIQTYFQKHAKVKEYMDQQIENCRRTGFSETILGRKRAIHEINASAYMVRQLGERLAMNSPIQGSAADIIKIAMIKVHRELKEKYPDSHLILQVHDELIIDSSRDELEEIKDLLVRNMEDAMKLSVKLLAEVNIGENWYDLK